jgi:peptidoglycan-N-acetylglucosamine deacetylase
MRDDYQPIPDLEPPTKPLSTASQKSSHPQRRLMWKVSGTLLLVVCLTASSIGLVNHFFNHHPLETHTVIAKKNFPSPTPSAMPTATPSPLEQWNKTQGCINGKPPPPLPGVVVTGKSPHSTLPPPMEVALTFDDGPTPDFTPQVLNALEKAHVPATFFVEGQYAHLWPQYVQREYQDGFAIGMHSWNHPDMTTVNDGQLHHQINDSLDAIRQAIGDDKACLWFWRPPYGSYNAHLLNYTRTNNLTSINWDDAGLDWTLPGAAGIAANVKRYLHPGAIILLHDGPANRQQTVDSIPLILQILNQAGLQPVTIPQLLFDAHYYGDNISWPPTTYN